MWFRMVCASGSGRLVQVPNDASGIFVLVDCTLSVDERADAVQV